MVPDNAIETLRAELNLAEVQHQRQFLIQLRDHALKEDAFQHAVILSHCIKTHSLLLTTCGIQLIDKESN